MPEPIIRIRGVTKRFGSHTVLSDITFDIPRGKVSAIMGPSGTGKSVLLKNIIGLLKPEAGEIWIDGTNIVGLARALSMDPEIVLFDEPDSGLDPVRVA